MKVHNMGAIPPEFMEGFGKGAQSGALSALCGSEKLVVNVDVIPPGSHSAKYHSHSASEEFFIILSGSGTLRTPEGTCTVATGDCLAKPAGFNNAHTFFNSGAELLKILDIATKEPLDVAFYPDDDVYLLRGEGGGRVVSEKTVPEGWTSEPDV